MARPLPPCILRLPKVVGFGERSNDIVYGSPIKIEEKSNVVVYFGGDVQDFTENMMSNQNKQFVEWNLESTVRLLQSIFIDCYVVVVSPVRKDFETFSIYENFVTSTKCGIPQHTSTHNALEHLDELLHNASEQLEVMTVEELTNAIEHSKKNLMLENSDELPDYEDVKYLSEILKKQPALNHCELKIMGFSKGCVVLNQFLHEFHHRKNLTPNSNDFCRIISRIREMYWLDGGHSGSFNTWMTSRPLLETLAVLGIQVHVHVTPYQIEDKRRPWIGKEEFIFSNTLQELGALIKRKIHFGDVKPSLQMHFKVLEVFGEK